MSQFVDFALTLGQQEAPKFGYASLGENLEQDGLGTAQEDIPGAVPQTSAELAVCDLTISEVQAGETTPTCGSGPGTGTPEVPFVLALPVAALGIFGGSVAVRRRRDRRIAFGVGGVVPPRACLHESARCPRSGVAGGWGSSAGRR